MFENAYNSLKNKSIVKIQLDLNIHLRLMINQFTLIFKQITQNWNF